MEADCSWGGGLEEVGAVPSTWELGVPFSTIVLRLWGWNMVVSTVGLRSCVAGGGVHALHWNMLSWLGLGSSRLLCDLRLRRVGRVVSGGFMLGFMCGEVAWVGGGGS